LKGKVKNFLTDFQSKTMSKNHLKNIIKIQVSALLFCCCMALLP